MTFENLHKDTECSCTDGAYVDTENEYIRKLRKNEPIEKDFITHWERNIGKDSTECEDICSYKAVSINQFSQETEELITNKYKTTFSINPKKGASLVKFKFKGTAGKVKPYPMEDDGSHYNFFKSDEFSLDSLNIIEIVKFA